MSRTTHPYFHQKHANRANSRLSSWREEAAEAFEAAFEAAYGDEELEYVNPEDLVPRIEWTLFAPPRQPPPVPIEVLFDRFFDLDRLWRWTGSEAQRALPDYVRQLLRESFLDHGERSEPLPWMHPYVSEALATVELSRVTNRPIRVWAARTRLGLVVASDYDLHREIIPQLRAAWR